MANWCALCSEKIGFFTQITIKDGFVCGNCQNKSLNMSNCDCRSARDYKDRFAYLEANENMFCTFNATIKIGKYLEVDEDNKLFKIGTSRECFPFSYLVNFELNEDGESIAKGGLGRAAVGGALFGGVGALVGGVTGGKKTKTMVKSMYIRINLNDKWVKNSQINLITTETKKGGFIYNDSKDVADRIISALELITQQQEIAPTPTIQVSSSADELMKFKQLLDAGAITTSEYEETKTKILNLIK